MEKPDEEEFSPGAKPDSQVTAELGSFSENDSLHLSTFHKNLALQLGQPQTAEDMHNVTMVNIKYSMLAEKKINERFLKTDGIQSWYINILGSHAYITHCHETKISLTVLHIQ